MIIIIASMCFFKLLAYKGIRFYQSFHEICLLSKMKGIWTREKNIKE